MTEQSKIPTPPSDESEGSESARKRGKSLFERADSAFGLQGFKAAPVPSRLAPPTNRQHRKAVRAEAPAEPVASPAPTTSIEQQSGAPENVATPQAVSSAPAPAVPAAPALPRVDFTAPPVAIDRDHLRQQGLIEPGGPVTGLLEEFRIVKRQVLLAAHEARRSSGLPGAQRVLVCSPLPGEGKTFCAANLALSIAAERDSEVLLVDADFAKPSILSTLGLPGGDGLMDALANPSIRVEDCVVATDIPGLFVLPAGNQTNSDSEFLNSARTAEVLDRLTQGAANRIVIFDSPPALAASPAAELAKYVEQALVVVRADRTGQSALEDALSLLSACPDIKLMLNAVHFSPSGRRFGSYYGQGG